MEQYQEGIPVSFLEKSTSLEGHQACGRPLGALQATGGTNPEATQQQPGHTTQDLVAADWNPGPG